MRSLFALLLCGLLLSTTAVARTAEVIETIDAQRFTRLLSESGFTEAEIDSDGDVVVRMQGYRVLFLIGTYEGKNIQARFAIGGSKAGMADMDRFNRETRFGSAYMDKDGDPAFDADLDLEGGITEARVKDYIRTVNELMVRFLRVVI
jgi:hypothetical protein